MDGRSANNPMINKIDEMENKITSQIELMNPLMMKFHKEPTR